jgi:hypothetical protein
MVEAILSGSGHDSEFIKLTDLNFSGCKGCVDRCAKRKVCMLEDDLFPYYGKLKKGDAVVIGSPVYFGSVNSAVISFIERFFAYRHVDIAIKGKPFVVALAGCGFMETAKDRIAARLMPFEVNILEVIEFTSKVFPCYSCGMHEICKIGGLYRTMGEEAHNLEIRPELFRAWEDDPETAAAVQAAGEKLKRL